MERSGVYSHSSPGKLFFGPGSLASLPEEMDKSLSYIIITDKGLAESGAVDRVGRVLEAAGIKSHVFDETHSDPPVEDCLAAAELARERGCGGVIGLGGGSSLDAAKGVAVLLRGQGGLKEYGSGKWVQGPVAPLYAIPTTAGTGSEVTRVAVITDTQRNEKMAVRGVHLAPLAAALDPELLQGLPPRIAAETGADALAHAVEAFVSLNSSPVTDALALSAIGLVGENLRRFVANPADAKAAEGMLVASCLAGQAFTNGGLGLAHSMGEPLGAFFHVSHGLSCAIYLPVIMEFNLPAAPEKFCAVARALGEEVDWAPPHRAARLAVSAVRELFQDVGLPLTFKEAGIEFELHQKMIDDVWPQFSTKCNPRQADPEQVASLYLAPGEED